MCRKCLILEKSGKHGANIAFFCFFGLQNKFHSHLNSQFSLLITPWLRELWQERQFSKTNKAPHFSGPFVGASPKIQTRIYQTWFVLRSHNTNGET